VFRPLPYKILHVITDLGMGGAEMVLYRLLAKLDRNKFTSQVVSLTTFAPVGELIQITGITVSAFGMRAGLPDPRLVTRLTGLMRHLKPDLVQTWMYHADLAGGLAARLADSPPVVWGLHHTVAEPGALKPVTYAIARVNALLSRVLPVRIVCCGEATRQTHARLGYLVKKMTVIPNGIDLVVYHPDAEARHAVRRELGLEEQTPLVGLCARFDPQKDHANFVRAAGILHTSMPGVHFLLWGKGADPTNDTLRGWICTAGVEDSFHLLGLRSDSARLMQALDLGGLSSAYGEAFPLVVGEAMACEVPCVVTDVGDSALLVGETGRVVPRHDPDALAGAWSDLLSLPVEELRALGRQARQRIKDHYSLEKMVAAYAGLYQDIITSSRFYK
jgi:glycosyltransferase involved in cell wall biosynthesis